MTNGIVSNGTWHLKQCRTLEKSVNYYEHMVVGSSGAVQLRHCAPFVVLMQEDEEENNKQAYKLIKRDCRSW